jgi:2-dehydro-3-deoxyphosphogluconate aldolase / (4S)-4-hydroxy-2-oxoglutarate aldolase
MNEEHDASVLRRIERSGVIPVVLPPKPALAADLGAALVEGGLPCIEIVFRAEGAPEAIEWLRATSPLLVGAGTVLTVAQARAAIAAGAQFLVSPGSNPAVIDLALKEGILILPGVATPSEIEANLDRGIDVVKLFPAEVLGGVRFLKAMSGPYATVKFVPTGGIDPKNLAEYLAQSNVLACGGSWIAPPASLAAGDFASIARLAREAAAVVQAARTGRAL